MSQTRILIVEDERIVAEDIRDRLEKLAYAVVGIAANADKAIALAEQDRPALVLMDIRLRGSRDGIDTAAEMRDRLRLPVIYLTAHSDDATLQRARTTQPYGYLLKPFSEAELRCTVEMALYKHQAEELLAEKERRWATTLRSIGDAVIAVGTDLHITFLNPEAERLTGWLLEEALGKTVDEVFVLRHAITDAPCAGPVAVSLRQGVTVHLTENTLLVSRNGRRFPIDDCAAPILDDTGALQGIVVVFRDIAEQRQNEERLKRLQRDLAQGSERNALRELTAGLAHELNQPLSVIANYTGACLRKLASPDDTRQDAQRMLACIGDQVRYMADTIRGMRELARQPPDGYGNKLLSVAELLDETLRLAQPQLTLSRVRVEPQLAAGLPRVRVHPLQLVQVLLNLLHNAVEALAECPSEQRRIVVQAVAVEGHRVALRVCDTGVGLAEGMRARLFEPFQTTKFSGMGLGLAISRRLVEAHCGTLELGSEPAFSTTFVVTLPGVGEPAT